MEKKATTRKTEKSLSSSQQYFMGKFENMAEGSQIIGFDWRYIYVNKVVASRLNKTIEQMIGRTVKEVFPDIETHKTYLLMQESMQKRISNRTEIKIEFSDGRFKWLDMSVSPIPEGIIILTLDITEKKKAEEALIFNESRYKGIFKNILAGIQIIGFDRRYIFINDEAAKQFEMSKPEVIGKGVTELFPRIIHNPAFTAIEESLNNKTVTCTDLKVLTKNQRTIWYGLSIRPVPEGILILSVDITERKKAEDLLKESQEFNQELLENSPNPILVINTDLTIRYANPALLALTGFSWQEIQGLRTPYPWWGPDEVKVYLVESSVPNKKLSVEKEKRFRRKNGEYFWVELNARTIMENGKIKYRMSTWTDISKRKQAEDALSASEAFNSGLIINAPNPILVLNTDSSIYYTNPAFEKMSGYSSKEILGAKIPYPWWPVPKMEEYSIEVSPMKNISNLERQYYNKKGETFWVNLSMNNILDDKGRTIYYIANWVDITERKRWEQTLQESQEKLQQIFASITAGIIILDLKGQIIDCNQSAVLLARAASKEVLQGKNILEFVDLKDVNRAKENIEDTIKLGSTYNLKYNVVRVDGTSCPVEVSSSVAKDSSNKPLFMVVNFSDITERHKMEERILDLYEKEKAEREELQQEAKARGMFIDVLAHELRTPLTPILASTGMLSDLINTSDDSIQKKLCNNIYSSAEILAHRLEELLDVARYSRGVFRLSLLPTDLNRFIDDVIKRFKPTIDQREQNLELTVADLLPVARIDQSRMEQVIINLLSNASKFTPDKGNIYFLATVERDQLVIEVRDQGIGISIEEQARLFQPYHRVEQDRQKFPGIGLGLAVAKQIVEAHGGKIWVTSQPEKGSTFSIEIPLV